MPAATEVVRGYPAKEILNVIFREADVFTAGAAQYDDMTVLLFGLNSE